MFINYEVVKKDLPLYERDTVNVAAFLSRFDNGISSVLRARNSLALVIKIILNIFQLQF